MPGLCSVPPRPLGVAQREFTALHPSRRHQPNDVNSICALSAAAVHRLPKAARRARSRCMCLCHSTRATAAESLLLVQCPPQSGLAAWRLYSGLLGVVDPAPCTAPLPPMPVAIVGAVGACRARVHDPTRGRKRSVGGVRWAWCLRARAIVRTPAAHLLGPWMGGCGSHLTIGHCVALVCLARCAHPPRPHQLARLSFHGEAGGRAVAHCRLL